MNIFNGRPTGHVLRHAVMYCRGTLVVEFVYNNMNSFGRGPREADMRQYYVLILKNSLCFVGDHSDNDCFVNVVGMSISLEKKKVAIPLLCHGHLRSVVDLFYSSVTSNGYFLISASK
ncbi:hypothetical protein ACJX0J_020502, partial [Zea mays]